MRFVRAPYGSYKPPVGMAMARPAHVSLSQGVVCYEAGDRIDRVYFPISGMISPLVEGRDGEAIEAGVIGREGEAGLQSGLGERNSYTRATIQIPGHFGVISAAHFERAVSDSPPLRDLVLDYLETRWADAQQIAACNAIHSGSARLCRWLLQAAGCTGSDQNGMLLGLYRIWFPSL